MNVKRLSLSSALCLLASGISLGAMAMDYPRDQAYPTPMCNPSVPCNFFKTQSTNDVDGLSYYPDGTLVTNPVVDNGQMKVNGSLYLIKKLDHNDSIEFLGKKYIVTSAIPLDMTIDYAYQHTAQYYSDKEVQARQIDITIPQQLNNGQPSSLQLDSSTVHTNGQSGQPVYSANTGFYVPNLPNNMDNYPYLSGPLTADLKKHDGLTGNIYWTIDAWMGNANAIDHPGGTNYHMIGYGWALDPRDVAQQLFLQELKKDGGGIYGPPHTIATFAPPFNSWMVLMNKDYQDPSTQKKNYDNYMGQISAWLDQASDTYPFPVPKDNKEDYWLKHGTYLPIQPMPGFQRNLVRWYTPWGAWNLVNNTSGLFMRNDGHVELPVNPKDNQPYPVVTQTWDDNQTFTVINQTNDIISSTYDSYPGSEVYFAGNAFLPANNGTNSTGSAGVITAYRDYTVFDSTGTLDPRQTDLWFGMKGSTPKDVMAWDDANGSEPGGQASKPYMVGADISHRGSKLMYTLRIQNSNSQPIAVLPAGTKVYATTLYVDPNGTGDYQRIGTLNYTWQNWQIDRQGQWAPSDSAEKGALVPSIVVDPTNKKNFQDWGVSIETVKEFNNGWHPSSRVMEWTESIYDNEVNKLGSIVYTYKLTASIANPKSRFVLLLSDQSSNQTLTAPTNLQSTDVTDKTATVDWTAAADSAADHTAITYTAIARSGTQSVNGVVSGTTAQFSGLLPNTNYTVTVTAQDTVAGANQTAAADLNVMTKQGTGPTENKYRIIIGNATMLYYQIADGALQSVKGDGSDAAVIPLPSKTPIVVFNSTKNISCNIVFDSTLPSGYSVTIHEGSAPTGFCTTGNIALHLGDTENQLIFPAWG